MRRLTSALTTALTAAAVLTAPAAPAPAHARTGGGWVPAPSEPWDRAAGVLCDFPVHVEPVVDEVRRRVLATYPNGAVRREAYAGDLVLAVTNTATGATTDVDASGTAVISYRPGGSFDVNSVWYAVGPAMFGFREDRGNRPRGIYRFDGVYRVEFDEAGYKTVTVYAGTETEICAILSPP